MILNFVCVIVGFVLLLVGADKLVAGASSIARQFGVSDLVIGLTVVAFGTSLPEFVVNILSTVQGSTDLALTNILGSNAINTYVILGVTALICPITSQATSRKWDIPLGIVAGLMVWGFVSSSHALLRPAGLILLGIFVCYMWHLARMANKEKKTAQEANEQAETLPTWKSCLFLVGGLIGLVLGGEAIVRGAQNIALQMGVSEAVIGLTVVALGTSLPELATSAIAALKHNPDLALGNVLGSNIFNVFLILGASSSIKSLPGYDGLELDAAMVAAGSLLIWLFVFSNKEHQIKRWAGLILLLLYGVYLTYRLLMVGV